MNKKPAPCLVDHFTLTQVKTLELIENLVQNTFLYGALSISKNDKGETTNEQTNVCSVTIRSVFG